jgi:hypothetical protein
VSLRLGACTVIPIPKRAHRMPSILEHRLRLRPVVECSSELCRWLKRKKQSIDRVFSRLKSHLTLDNLSAGQSEASRASFPSQHAVYALTAAKPGFESPGRSPISLTA